ncbi:MAG: diphthine--ammonia ligase [Balneolaceae bacterium]|jgi:uncharacterized protein (TIGR00290 family)
MKKTTLLSWSSGKDCAWALYKLRLDPKIDLKGLFCTINKTTQRISMHGVSVSLLKQQAKCIGLPLKIIEIPSPCSDDEYAQIMNEFVEEVSNSNIDHFAFGDLYLEDVRDYREKKLHETGISPLFPLWGESTGELASAMLEHNLQAVITTVDQEQISEDFIGRRFNTDFLSDLPKTADPCGENGEFHSFVYNGPMFQEPVEITLGNKIEYGSQSFIEVYQKH